MNELYNFFRSNFPYCVREESTVRELLIHDENKTIITHDSDHKPIAASVSRGNNILFLCVDKVCRGGGIGSYILDQTEEMITSQGFKEITIGAGSGYIMPGVPTSRPVITESLEEAKICAGIDDSAKRFLEKRGYRHSWDCNCFDMRLDLDDFNAKPTSQPDVTYRWATASDFPAVLTCTNDAHADFTKYYDTADLYKSWGQQRALIAETKGEIVGTLIVSFEKEGEGIGSIGCTAVKPSHRRKGIASNLVVIGTSYLKEAGLKEAFLGYTYSGLDKLYARAGYKISTYYFMAKKEIDVEEN